MFSNRNKSKDQSANPPASGVEGDAVPGGVAGEGGDAVAHQTDELLNQIDTLTRERDEAKAAYMRALADFQNYQRRSIENEREAKRQGTTSFLLSVVPVIDHFDFALTHDASKMTGPQVVDGVRAIRDELLRVLGNHGVTVINPSPNDELDPHRHQAVVHQPGQGVDSGNISHTLQVGYALGDRVIRPANVAVAP